MTCYMYLFTVIVDVYVQRNYHQKAISCITSIPLYTQMLIVISLDYIFNLAIYHKFPTVLQYIAVGTPLIHSFTINCSPYIVIFLLITKHAENSRSSQDERSHGCNHPSAHVETYVYFTCRWLTLIVQHVVYGLRIG